MMPKKTLWTDIEKALLPKEKAEQRAVVEWLKWHPILKHCVISIQNEHAGGEVSGHHRKLMGVMAGASDLFIAYPCGGKHGLFIEMKRRRLAKVSEEQIIFTNRMKSLGYEACICYGYDHAIKAIGDYLSSG